MFDGALIENQLTTMLDTSRVRIYDKKPSEWAEKNVIIKAGGNQGPLRYRNTPYAREIIDCLAEDHPARKITFQKGQQIGASATVIIPALVFIMANMPAPTIFSVGDEALIKLASKKLDMAIKNAGLTRLLDVEARGKSNNKTGDTITLKEFIGGWIMLMTLNNHDKIRDFACKNGFLDDLDANSGSSKDFGDTLEMIYGRFSSYEGKQKIVQVSTPKLKLDSMIEPQYKLGDQRLFYITCPRCHTLIDLDWKHKDGGHMHWETKNGILIPSSVGYVCQVCSQFFDDKKKMKWLNESKWIPQVAEPVEHAHYSYKMGCLYSPTFMIGWRQLVEKYLLANPPSGRDEKKWQVFLNTWMGETYEPPAVSLNSQGIQKNIRPYSPGTVPDDISVRDGNGRIVLLTMGCDLNGRIIGVNGAKEHDVRLDWEMVAHSESGSVYSIMHGSIGTWQRGDGENTTRQKWTPELDTPFSVWTELDRIIDTIWMGDNGMAYRIARTGIDTGFGNIFVYAYLERSRHSMNLVGIRGEKEYQMLNAEVSNAYIKLSPTRTDEVRVQVGYIKDDIARYMQLTRTPGQPQQPNFMNFPQREGGLYELENYFEHFESEKRTLITDKNGKTQFRWEKKNTHSVNHMLDCRVYNYALREIIVDEVKRAHPDKPRIFEWPDYVAMVRESMGD